MRFISGGQGEEGIWEKPKIILNGSCKHIMVITWFTQEDNKVWENRLKGEWEKERENWAQGTKYKRGGESSTSYLSSEWVADGCNLQPTSGGCIDGLAVLAGQEWIAHQSPYAGMESLVTLVGKTYVSISGRLLSNIHANSTGSAQ